MKKTLSEDCKHCQNAEEREEIVRIRMVHLKADDNWSPDQDKKDQLEDGDIGPLLLQKKQNEHNMALCAQ